MKKTVTSLTLSLSEDALIALTTSIEERIIKKIRKDPTKFFPKGLEKPKEITFYSTKEVAERLRTSTVTVRNLCKDGKLQYFRPAGRDIMISEEHLNSYLQTTKNASNE